jgi:hypothetical protein
MLNRRAFLRLLAAAGSAGLAAIKVLAEPPKHGLNPLVAHLDPRVLEHDWHPPFVCKGPVDGGYANFGRRGVELWMAGP